VIYGATGDTLYIYVYDLSFINPPVLSNHPQTHGTVIEVRGKWKNPNGTFESFSIHDDQFRIISSDQDWKLLEVSTDRLVDFKSLQVDTVSEYRGSSNLKLGTTSGLVLNTTDSVIHVGFTDGDVHEGLDFNPVTLNKSYTVEFVANPSKEQKNFANILGNHPDYLNFGGFVVQQEYNLENAYYFSYGDGKQFFSPFRFSLNASEINYIAISSGSNEMKLYKNGELIQQANISSNLKNSRMPLYVGNWINDDRPFNGKIYEIKITNHSVGNAEIMDNWKRIQAKINS
jgi:hypothetical protein